jgi:DNA modification methylase
MTVRILIGDCRDKLRELPDASVHCCVTSPPYFGLRDYGHEGQMGLEPTPDEYVAGMVEVFREVRRALRDDGTLWLNIGDSYANGGGVGQPHRDTSGGFAGSPGTRGSQGYANAGGGYCRPNTIGGAVKQKDLIGIPWMLAFALRQPWTDWQIKDEAMRGWVAGLVDGEGCITIQQTKSSHSESLSFPPIVQVKMCDREPLDRLVAVAGSKIGEAQFPPSHAAANQRPSWQWKVSAERAAKIIAEIYPFLTCKRKQAIVAWNHQQFRTQRGNQARAQSELEREQFCKALINGLNQRKPVDLPSWMIEPKIVQEPGWYLRQDCIWSKPNPMPESVRDRCTKAHEYLFLLSKGPRYHFDAQAIAEPLAVATVSRLAQDVESQAGSNRVPGKTNGPMKAVGPKSWKGSCFDSGKTAEHQLGRAQPTRKRADRFGGNKHNGSSTKHSDGSIYEGGDTRNKRSVWEVATQPFSEAHFATFPPALIEPCILAGCAKGGTVLDPFGGAGTTGLVADRLQRNAILIELNEEYAEIARRRLAKDGGMFSEVLAA